MKIYDIINESTSEHPDFLAGYFDILMLTDDGWTKRVASTVPRERIGVVMKGLAKKYNTEPDDFKPVKAQGIVDEVSKPTLARYVKAAGKDVEQRASSQSFASGKRGDVYNKVDPTHADTRREKGVDLALRKLTREQGVAETQFNSKQEVINHFVKQGKSAAAGASAWERGWRGHTPKKKTTQAPLRSYHDDLDDRRYGSKEGVAEGRLNEDIIGPNNKGEYYIIDSKEGGPDHKVAGPFRTWEEAIAANKQRKRKTRQAEQGVAEEYDPSYDPEYRGYQKPERNVDWDIEAERNKPEEKESTSIVYVIDDETDEVVLRFKSTGGYYGDVRHALKHGYDTEGGEYSIKWKKAGVNETATAGATSAGNVGVGAIYKNKPAKQAKNKDGTAKNALDIKANLLTGGSIKR